MRLVAYSRRAHAEPVEKRAAWMAVRRHAKILLQLADVVAQVEIKMAVEIGDLVAEACEFLLQRDALGARWLDIVDRPGAAEGVCAVQPVGQMRHRERIGVGIVVGFEYDEILRHQKRRAGRAARKEQNGVAGLRPAAAVEAFETAGVPLAKRAAADAIIEFQRRQNLKT